MAWMAALGIAMMLSTTSEASSEASSAARMEQADVHAAGNNRLLYRESHWVYPRDAGRWVLYRCPDGRAFARKRVASGGATPNFSLEDVRGDYAEGVRGSGSPRSVYVRHAGKEASQRLRVPADGVIDAGFDAAVRAHWDSLMRGESVRLQFLIPSRKRFYPVQVRRTGGIEWHGMRAERLQMKLDTWFGFAVPAVTLVYGRDDRRLLEFTGTGNVRNSDGTNPQVRIAFAKTARAASAEELDAIRSVPLDGRCVF